jgi:hypothetical protein
MIEEKDSLSNAKVENAIVLYLSFDMGIRQKLPFWIPNIPDEEMKLCKEALEREMIDCIYRIRALLNSIRTVMKLF